MGKSSNLTIISYKMHAELHQKPIEAILRGIGIHQRKSDRHVMNKEVSELIFPLVKF